MPYRGGQGSHPGAVQGSHPGGGQGPYHAASPGMQSGGPQPISPPEHMHMYPHTAPPVSSGDGPAFAPAQDHAPAFAPPQGDAFGCWGAQLQGGGGCTPGFVPGKLHSQKKAHSSIALALVLALALVP